MRDLPCSFQIVAKGFSLYISRVIHGVGCSLGRVCVFIGACLSRAKDRIVVLTASTERLLWFLHNIRIENT